MRKNNLAKEIVEIKAEYEQRILSLTEFYEHQISNIEEEYTRSTNRAAIFIVLLVGVFAYFWFTK